MFVVVLAAVTVFVALPLYRPSQRAADPGSRLELQARHQVLIAALRELEIDRASGALEHEDYEAERASLELQAARTLRELEQPRD